MDNLNLDTRVIDRHKISCSPEEMAEEATAHGLRCPECGSGKLAYCPGGTCQRPTKRAMRDIRWLCEDCLNEFGNPDSRLAYVCKRCGWHWFSRMNPPTVCPHCHSAYWDKDKKDVNDG